MIVRFRCYSRCQLRYPPVAGLLRLDARDIGPGPGTTPVRSGHEHVADLGSLCRVPSHGTRERGRRIETRARARARRQGRTTKFGEVAPLPPLFARKKPYIMLAPCCVLCACARLRLKLFTFTPRPPCLCATNTVETGPAVSAVSGVTVSAEALTTLHTSDTLCSVGSYAQRAAHGEGVL